MISLVIAICTSELIVTLAYGPGVLVADDPRVEMDDRVAPGTDIDAAMRKIVIFLNGAVQLANRVGEWAGRKTGKIVKEEFDALSGSGAREIYEENNVEENEGEENAHIVARRSCRHGHSLHLRRPGDLSGGRLTRPRIIRQA